MCQGRSSEFGGFGVSCDVFGHLVYGIVYVSCH